MHGVRVLRLLSIAIALAFAGGVATRGQAPAPAPATSGPATPAPATTSPRPTAPRPSRPPAPAAPPAKAASAGAAAPGHTFDSLVKPFVMENCASCHGARRQKGQLNLQAYDSLEALTNDADRWEMVVQKLRDGEMPPEDEEPRPTPKQVDDAHRLRRARDRQGRRGAPPDPGRVTTRRLNRTEYNNTVRDLLGVDLRPADDFPHDDSGYGFDNIGDVLSTLAAAGREAARGGRAHRPHRRLRRRRDASRRCVKLPMLNGRVRREQGRPGQLRRDRAHAAQRAHATYRVPVDAEYVVRLITGGRRPQGSMPMTLRAVDRRHAGRRGKSSIRAWAPASSRASRS